MSLCGHCSCDPCGCNSRPTWRPSTTTARAIWMMRQLLKSGACSVDYTDCQLCRFLKIECDMCGGKYSIASLALLVSARIVESEALKLARIGNTKTLTVSISGATSSRAMLDIARAWREQADNCMPKLYFATARTARSCLYEARTAYGSVGCDVDICNSDAVPINGCNFDCCDDCD